MLINQLDKLIIKYHMQITGILHVGAHKCEELKLYINNGVDPNKIIWIEGNPDIYNYMRLFNIPNLYCALISDKEELVDFIITNNGMSSSILELDEHKKEHPEVHEISRIKLKTQRIDNLLINNNININFNFVVLDIQGVELQALKSMGNKLNNIDYIYTEVNNKHLYKDCPLIGDIDEYLSNFNFIRVETDITPWGWGDALYIKKLL
jgi:FkbM family methyltransferase